MKKQRLKGKAKAQREHGRRRARQRYGLWLSDEELDGLIRRIQRGDGEHLEKQSLRVSVWRLQYEGHDLIVVYDSHRKQISSFLPPGAEPPFMIQDDEDDDDDAFPPRPFLKQVPPKVSLDPQTWAPPHPKAGGSGRSKRKQITRKKPKPPRVNKPDLVAPAPENGLWEAARDLLIFCSSVALLVVLLRVIGCLPNGVH